MKSKCELSHAPPPPLVSVAMATCNGAAFVRPQIESILDQTYEHVELIVSDDASTDGTADILAEYQSAGKLVLVKNGVTLGYKKNFEQVVSLCTGEFIALSDQDDIWVPKKVETLTKAIGKHAMIYSDSLLVDENGRSLGRTLSHRRRRRFQAIADARTLYFDNCIFGHAMMFRRDVLPYCLPFPDGVEHDTWLPYAATILGGIAYCDECLVHYRQHGESVANKMQAAKSRRGFLGKLKNKARKQQIGNQLRIDRLTAFLGNGANTPKDMQRLRFFRDQFENFDRYFFNSRVFGALIEDADQYYPLTTSHFIFRALKESLGLKYFKTFFFS